MPEMDKKMGDHLFDLERTSPKEHPKSEKLGFVSE